MQRRHRCRRHRGKEQHERRERLRICRTVCTLCVLLDGKKLHRKQRGMSRTGLRLATATPALAALRPAHDHARAEHARHARCTRASLASDARALTLQHALARQKQGWCARVTGHWLTVGRPTACASGLHTNCKCSLRARRAGIHARCFGLTSLDVLHVVVALFADTRRRAR